MTLNYYAAKDTKTGEYIQTIALPEYEVEHLEIFKHVVNDLGYSFEQISKELFDYIKSDSIQLI